MEDIVCLTSLEYLGLSCIECEKLPDLSMLKLLKVVKLFIEGKTFELCRLSSELTRFLHLILFFCYSPIWKELGSSTCCGISNLMALEELEIVGAVNVGVVFNLHMLTNLRRLTISDCQSIKELQGFDDLLALNSLHLRRSGVCLQELEITNCLNLRKLPHMGKLTNLRILVISVCSIQSLPALGELVGLEVLVAEHCSKLSEIFYLHKLSNLQKLDLQECALRTVRGLDGLEALKRFFVHRCGQLVELLRLCKLRDLRELEITHCFSLKSLPSLEGLINLRVLRGGWLVLEAHKLPTQLEELTIYGWRSKGLQNSANLESRLDYRDLAQLNSLQILPAVFSLKLWKCNFRVVSGLFKCTGLRNLDIGWCREVEGLPDLPHLKTLDISHSETKAVINMGFFPELEHLDLGYLAYLTELPDLGSCCPKLSHLEVVSCKELRSLRRVRH